MLGKILADNILKYFSYFPRKIGFGIYANCLLGDSKLLEVSKPSFAQKNRKNTSLSSTELANSAVKIKLQKGMYFKIW